MAGIYIHIPLCASRCYYCDFYSSTDVTVRQQLVDAICAELRMRAGYLRGETVRTIYFGGGTPSTLPVTALQQIFDTIYQTYKVEAEEVTIEANPDDLTDRYVAQLHTLPVNRVSMGVQSFYDDDLKRINRRHSAQQAVEAVTRLRKAGIDNISIDLIYGLPFQTAERWQHNLDVAVGLHPQHISAYHLTYEEGTVLYRKWQQGEVSPVSEDDSLLFFKMLRRTLLSAGYQHYEISNFALPDCYARHNSSYWNGTPYLGIGPSAHSFDGENRQWNVSDTKVYIEAVNEGRLDCEVERLTEDERFNDLLITSLRTAIGLDLSVVKKRFPNFERQLMRDAEPALAAHHLEVTADNHLRLTEEGIFISDAIFVDLIRVGD